MAIGVGRGGSVGGIHRALGECLLGDYPVGDYVVGGYLVEDYLLVHRQIAG